jgi:hypothetical protein
LFLRFFRFACSSSMNLPNLTSSFRTTAHTSSLGSKAFNSAAMVTQNRANHAWRCGIAPPASFMSISTPALAIQLGCSHQCNRLREVFHPIPCCDAFVCLHCCFPIPVSTGPVMANMMMPSTRSRINAPMLVSMASQNGPRCLWRISPPSPETMRQSSRKS